MSIPLTNTLFAVMIPTNFASPLTYRVVDAIPTAPTSRLNLGADVPIPTLFSEVL